MGTRDRAFTAFALAFPLLLVSGWAAFAFVSGIDALDGVTLWDDACFETTFIEGAYQIVASVMFAVGLWVALVAWVFAHRVWRGALAAAALGLAIFIAGVALLSGPDRYLPSGRCSGSFVD